MNRGSFRAGNTQGRQLRTGGDPRCDQVTEMVNAASAVFPSAVRFRGSPLRARKPPPGLGSSNTGISIGFRSLSTETEYAQGYFIRAERAADLTVGSFSITARSSFPSPAMGGGKIPLNPCSTERGVGVLSPEFTAS